MTASEVNDFFAIGRRQGCRPLLHACMLAGLEGQVEWLSRSKATLDRCTAAKPSGCCGELSRDPSRGQFGRGSPAWRVARRGGSLGGASGACPPIVSACSRGIGHRREVDAGSRQAAGGSATRGAIATGTRSRHRGGRMPCPSYPRPPISTNRSSGRPGEHRKPGWLVETPAWCGSRLRPVSRRTGAGANRPIFHCGKSSRHFGTLRSARP